MKNKKAINMRKLSLILVVGFVLLLVLSFASAKSFTVHNTTNESQPYFSVNGTTGNIGIGTTAPTTILQILNNKWISAKNYLGTGVVNMFKINIDDQIELGATLNIGNFEFDEDSGLVTLVDMPVSSTPSAGTSESYVFKVDQDNIMTIYSEADGSGGVQNKRVGIGTISPKNTLNVIGDANITGLIYGNGSQLTDISQAETDPKWTANYSAYNDSWTTTNTEIWNVIANDTYVPYTGSSANVVLGNNNFTVNGTTFHVDTNTGMVGIGTSSPDVKLDIYSNSASSGLRLRGPTPTSEIGDIYVDAGGNFNIDTRSGTEAGYIAIRPEDADYGMLLFETDGGTSAFANFAVIDGTSDYLNIVVGATDSTIGLVVDSNDNVGIGTITPQRKLHVNGSILSNATINATGDICIEGGNCLSSIVATESDPKWTANYTAYNNSWTTTDAEIWNVIANDTYVPYTGAVSNVDLGNNNFTVNGTTLHVDVNTGNVGIGTDSPESELHVMGNLVFGNGSSSERRDIYLTDSDGGFRIFATDTLAASPTGAAIQFFGIDDVTRRGKFYLDSGAHDDAALIFRTAPTSGTITERLRITSGGNVGVGTDTTPDYKLDVQGTFRADGVSSFGGIINTNNNWISGDGGAEGIYIANNGNVGIGTGTPQRELHVNGDILSNATINATGDICIEGGNCLSSIVATESDPKWTANYTAYNDSWSSITNTSYYLKSNPYTFWNDTYATFNKTYADTLYSTIDEPLWTANYTAYNDSWTTTNTEIWNVIANDTYVPYTGSNANVVLGDYNLSVGTSDLFVDASSGRVGIGTSSPSTLLQIANDGWISAKNNAGTGTVNMFKVNANDQIEVGGTLNIGSFEFDEDSGLVTFVDMPVSSTPSAGTSESYVFKVDGENIMIVYAEADGSGGVQNKRVGIGTITPQNTLNVIGDANITGLIYGNGSQLTDISQAETDPKWTANYTAYNDSWTTTNTEIWNVIANDTYVPYTGAVSNVDLGDNNFTVNGTTFHVDTSTGRVGIGTSSPGVKFQMHDSVGSAGLMFSLSNVEVAHGVTGFAPTDVVGGFASQDHDQGGLRLLGITERNDGALVMKGISQLGDAVYGTVQIDGSKKSGASATALDADDILLGITTGGQAKSVFMGDGSLGIGTKTPSQKLDVNGTINIANGSSLYMNDNPLLVYDVDTGSIGVGQTGITTFPSGAGGNVLVGKSIGYSLTTGDRNVLMGFQTGRMIETGSHNFGMGSYTLSNTGTAITHNVGIGGEVFKNIDGNYNVAIGGYAGWALPTGNYNTFLGGSSGSNASFTSGTGNTFIGYRSGADFGTGSYNILIGYDVQALNGSNQINIGDRIYGSSGNIGINTSTPQNTLNIVGDINATGLIYGNGSQLTDISQAESDPKWTANYSAYNDSWSSITNTSYYLKSNPYTFWNDTYATFNKTYADTLYSTINEPLWTANYTAYNSSWSSTYNASYVPYIGATQNVVLGANNFSVDSTTLFVDSNTERVGIGITSPEGNLHVYEDVNGVVRLVLENPNSGSSAFTQFSLVNDVSGANLDLFSSTYTTANWRNKAAFIMGGALDGFIISTKQTIQFDDESANTKVVFNMSNGNVGIGDSTPGELLEVAGNINSTGGDICITGGNCLSSVVASETDPKWTANYSAYNDSWSSITNTSYYLKSNPYTFWNDTYATFNKTYADTLYSTIDEPLWTANYTMWNTTWSTDTTYSASGVLLDLTGTTFSVNNGTLTNAKGCKFVTGTGIVCDQDYLTGVSDVWVNESGDTMTGNLNMSDNNITDVRKLTLNDEAISTEQITFDGDTSAGLKLSNSDGYITLTPLNSGWAHIYTDRTKFIFNQPVYSVDDAFSSYDADLLLQRAGTTEITVGSTMTTIADDLTVSGDDLYMATNTANYFLMADSTNYNPTSPADARTGLGLTAGGAGDIWVEKGGDTMTGDLRLDVGANSTLFFDTAGTGDSGIRGWGEHLIIFEPEDSNKIWAKFTDDASFHLIGTPNLIVDGTSTLTGEVQVGGGYGSTGTTLQTDGDIFTSGKVGIGNATPAYPLSVSSSGTHAIFGQGKSSGMSYVMIGEKNAADKMVQLAYSHDNNYFGMAIGGNSVSTGLIVADGNKVGIGTYTPQNKLNVIGDANITGNLVVDTNTLFVGGANHRVGIGTATPYDLLHIYEDDSGVTPHSFSLLNVESDTNLAVTLMTPNTQTQSYAFADPENSLIGAITYTHDLDKMYFTVNGSTGMMIDGTGKVGIGTTFPKTDLTVEGTITLKEQADADTDTAAYGQIWVNTASPNELYFTDDAGGDHQLTGTSYWSCQGVHFDGYPSANTLRSSSGWIQAEAVSVQFVANVDLPHSAVVTGAVVYGNTGAQAETWYLERIDLDSLAKTVMATALIGTEDTTISVGTIDNTANSYLFRTGTLDTGDRIYGARITYTL